MKIFSPKEELLKLLNGEKIEYFPRSIPLYSPIVDIMKETGAFFPAGNYEAEQMAKLAMGAHELGGWNSLMLPWASTVEMEALGCEVTIKDKDIAGYPQLKRPAFKDAYDAKFGRDILKKASFPAVFEATKIVRDLIEKKYGGEIPVVSLTQGPFTIAANVIGILDMFKHVIKDRKRARFVLEVVSDLNILYANKMLECGGDLVLIGDAVAQGLSKEQFDDILLPIYQKISKEVKAGIILHICGKTSRIVSCIPDTGFEAFSFDYPYIKLEELKELGKKVKLVGSVPTITHLLEGSVKDVKEVTTLMIENGIDILSPSCGLPQYSPLANIKAMADTIKDWNRTKFGLEFD